MFNEVTDNSFKVPAEGKTAVIFHIPGHCAGCKRVLDSLSKRPCEEWELYTINAENDELKSLVEDNKVQTAPTILLYENGELTQSIIGLKQFLTVADSVFGKVFSN